MDKLSASDINFQILFESIPGLYLVLNPDFMIQAVSNDFLKTSRKTRQGILNKYLFDEFPDNEENTNTEGMSKLKESLNIVLTKKVIHEMDIIKYDIPLPDGTFQIKYWKTVNSPVFDNDGNITHIIHKTEDVTDFFVLKEIGDKQLKINIELQKKTDDIEEEFNQISRELNKSLPELSLLQAVKELESERAKFFNLLNNAPAYICIFETSEHIYTFINPLYKKFLKDQLVLGKSIREARPELEGQGFFELLDDVYSTGKPYVGTETHALIDNQSKYFNFVYQPAYDINNQVYGINVFFFDVTEQVLSRKQLEAAALEILKSEDKYKKLSVSLEEKVIERTHQLNNEKNKFYSLFMNAPIGITFLRGKEHIYEFVNPFYQKYILEKREILGKSLRDAYPELEGQGIYELYDEVYNTGQPYLGKERLVKLDKKGNGILESFYFDFIYQPIFDINNQIEGISTFAFDITEQVMARKEVEKLNQELFESEANYRLLSESLELKIQERTKELKRSNKELQNFAHIASHDLQEPLRTVSSYSELLARRYSDKLDNSGIEYIKLIVEATKRMKLLIEDVLTHSKIQKNLNDEQNSDINKVIEVVKSNLKATIEKNNVILNYDKLPNIMANNTYMLQLFQNLIANAIKYRKKDIAPIINIKVNSDDNYWIFSISDNGIGIEEKYFDKIFDIFQRLHTREEYQGTGIGLASCKKIIELYGGKIWIESKLNVGSTFFFTLPKKL